MSTVEIHKNVVDADTVQQLVDFFYTDKSGLDVRPDNISKNINWSQEKDSNVHKNIRFYSTYNGFWVQESRRP